MYGFLLNVNRKYFNNPLTGTVFGFIDGSIYCFCSTVVASLLPENLKCIVPLSLWSSIIYLKLIKAQPRRIPDSDVS